MDFNFDSFSCFLPPLSFATISCSSPSHSPSAMEPDNLPTPLLLCEDCDCTFNTHRDLLLHRSHHPRLPGAKGWKCDYDNCEGRRFTALRFYRPHVRSVHKIYICGSGDCALEYDTVEQIHVHVKTTPGHHYRVCPDPVCGEILFTEYSLIQHSAFFHPPLPPLPEPIPGKEGGTIRTLDILYVWKVLQSDRNTHFVRSVASLQVRYKLYRTYAKSIQAHTYRSRARVQEGTRSPCRRPWSAGKCATRFLMDFFFFFFVGNIIVILNLTRLLFSIGRKYTTFASLLWRWFETAASNNNQFSKGRRSTRNHTQYSQK